uniref:Uncharacterized protein n=1 Tax=Arion vulgaris TaxID=1028688 RepID=A0A0B6Z0Y8_9EUPU
MSAVRGKLSTTIPKELLMLTSFLATSESVSLQKALMPEDSTLSKVIQRC